MADIKEIYENYLNCVQVVIDTRKIVPGSFFVALQGSREHANKYASIAIEQGASYVLIDDVSYYIDNRTIVVEDTLKTLQELAIYHRQNINFPIIALTGSNGKTTTKEMILSVLSQNYIVKGTVGNLNNHIGVPLTLLSFDKNLDFGIVEMGANHQKEIEFLCSIAQPDYGYITNFGKAHLEGFGGAEGVVSGKSEMYTYLRSNDKIAFVNVDDSLQVQKSEGIKRCSFTFGNSNCVADYEFSNLTSDPEVSFVFATENIKSHLIGLYNAPNIGVAVAVGLFFGMSIGDIVKGVEDYVPNNNRSQILKFMSNDIILDAYNANPSSMSVAIDNFVGMSTTKKRWMILGDMFELGELSLVEHSALVNKINSLELEVCVVFVGYNFYMLKEDLQNVFFFETFESFVESGLFKSITESFILIKGSRGMALERLLST